eukprot:4875630-Prorocentrum_lima.AAC.1
MTSSLVGSEMCIRDRTDVRQELHALHFVPPIEADMWTVTAVRGRLTSFAVSYTHLTLPTICSV